MNDGKDAFDASYFNYITDWWDHVCPQVNRRGNCSKFDSLKNIKAGISLGGEFVNPLLVEAAQDPELNATMRGVSFFLCFVYNWETLVTISQFTMRVASIIN